MKNEIAREKEILAFQKKIGYTFKNKELLYEALTHSSYANESGLHIHNERMEFLGDAVLELITSERLYLKYSELDEGLLTRLRSQIVCEKKLYEWAFEIGLPKLIKIGKSLVKRGSTQAMAADAAEAVFGAVFIDGGYSCAVTVVNSFIDSQENTTSPYTVNPKTELQEILQGKGMGVPYYKTVERSGLDHELQFKVQVTIGETILACAWGSSIKEAEFKAAEIALTSL